MTTNTEHNAVAPLPPLPLPAVPAIQRGYPGMKPSYTQPAYYTSEQMHAYAREALAASAMGWRPLPWRDQSFESADKIKALAAGKSNATGEVRSASVNYATAAGYRAALAASHSAPCSSQQVVRGEAVAWRFYVEDDNTLIPFWTGWSLDPSFRAQMNLRGYSKAEYAYPTLTERSVVETRSGSHSQPADKPAGQADVSQTDAQIRAVAIAIDVAWFGRDGNPRQNWKRLGQNEKRHRERVARAAIAALAPEPDTAGDADEDSYVIGKLSRLLAEIAIIVNGPAPDMTLWSYHDLPEKVRALKATPAATVPDGVRDLIGALAALEVPERPNGSAGFYAIRHADIERAKQLIAASPANRPAEAHRGVLSVNFRGESASEIRSVLVNSLVSGKCWMHGYAEAYVDEAVAMLAASPDPLPAETPAMGVAAPTVDAAKAMGETGASPTDAERLAFEAWMSGHCWALGANWNGTEYTNATEHSGYVCPVALRTRMLWAAWRDRAALASAPAPGVSS